MSFFQNESVWEDYFAPISSRAAVDLDAYVVCCNIIVKGLLSDALLNCSSFLNSNRHPAG